MVNEIDEEVLVVKKIYLFSPPFSYKNYWILININSSENYITNESMEDGR